MQDILWLLVEKKGLGEAQAGLRRLHARGEEKLGQHHTGDSHAAGSISPMERRTR